MSIFEEYGTFPIEAFPGQSLSCTCFFFYIYFLLLCIVVIVLWCLFYLSLQSTLVISTSLISNNRLSRTENLDAV